MFAAKRLLAVAVSAMVLAGLGIAAPARADIPIGGGAGNPDWIVQSQVAQPWTTLQASAQQIVAEEHHVPNDAKLLRWARGEIRSVMFFELMAIVNTPAAQRTSDQQADVDVLTNLVHARGLQAAQTARHEYTVWQNDPCGYKPIDGYPYDPGCTPIGGIFQGTPDPPPASAFESMGESAAYPELTRPSAISAFTTAMTASAILSGTLTGASIATAASLAGVFPAAATATLSFFKPFAVQGITKLFATAGETATEIAIDAAGAAIWGTVVGVVVEAVSIAVLRGINVFTAAAIPDSLDQAVTDAQQPTDLAALEADPGGMAKLFTAFTSQTIPDPTVGDTSGPQPGPWNPSDASVRQTQSADDPGTTQQTFQVLNWDQTSDTVWIDHGYFVVQYPDGHREWALDLNYINPLIGFPGQHPYRTAALVGNHLVTGPVSTTTAFEVAAAQQPSSLCPDFPAESSCVDLNYLALVGGGSSYQVQIVPQRTTTMSFDSTPAAPVFGQPFTLTAHLSTQDGRAPTGSVLFSADGTVIGTAPIGADGTARLDSLSWHAGVHHVRVDYHGNDDYDSSVAVVDPLNVARASQNLHANPLPNTPVNVPDINPGATADSGLPVTYTTNSAACRIVDNKVHLVGEGSCVISAQQAGNDDYEPGTLQLSFTVLPAYDGPTVKVTTPADGAILAHGSTVAAAYTCLSPYTIFYCIGSVPVGAPVDTAELGTKTFTVSTLDSNNRGTTKSITYTVVPGAPATLQATGGSGQTAPAGLAYNAPLTAVVKDSLGSPVPGAAVTFTVASGSAHFLGGSASASVRSDSRGVATSPLLIAGLITGGVTVTASSAQHGIAPVSFSQKVTAPAGLRLTVASPGTAGVPSTVTSTATDSHGATAGDVSSSTALSIKPATGGASCTNGTSTSPATCTATASGRYTITGNDGGTTASTTLTIDAAAAATMTATSGDSQIATSGSTYAKRLVATVVDAFGNPVADVPVTFHVTSGSAGFPGGAASVSAVTTSHGVATSPALTAGPIAGPVVVTASSGPVSGASAAVYLETVSASGPARADLSTRLSAPASVSSHGSIPVTVTVANLGPSASGRYTAAVLVPRGFTVTDSGGGTRYSSLVEFTGTTLNAGESARYTIVLKADTARGTVTLGAAALAATRDPNYHDNLAAAAIKIAP